MCFLWVSGFGFGCTVRKPNGKKIINTNHKFGALSVVVLNDKP